MIYLQDRVSRGSLMSWRPSAVCFMRATASSGESPGPKKCSQRKERVPQFWARACCSVPPCTATTAVEVARNVEMRFLLLVPVWGRGVEVAVVVVVVVAAVEEDFLRWVLMWAWRSVVAWVKLDIVCVWITWFGDVGDV